MNNYANVDIHPRTFKKMPSTSRRRCTCGCKTRATLMALCNGLGMGAGCQMSIRRWAKEKRG